MNTILSLILALLLAPLAALRAAVPVPLWDERESLLNADELPVLNDVDFSEIKLYEFRNDGYRFLHGVAFCFHNGPLYA